MKNRKLKTVLEEKKSFCNIKLTVGNLTRVAF